MTTVTEPRKTLSTGERQRQIEESVSRAMALYKREGDAVRANTERLRALREAHEAANPVTSLPRKGRKPVKGLQLTE